nr:thiamine biosynthesis protein [Corynebacterium lactis]
MTTRTSRRLALLAVPALAALPLLAACGGNSGGNSGASSTPESSSSSAASETGTATEAAAPTIEAEPVNNLSDGDVISVKLSGLDTAFGYYAAICAAEKTPGNPVPDCTGDRSSTARTQHWITNKPGGTTTITEDGTATFELGVASTGEKANCTEQACVLKLFGDHSEGFEDVAEVPVTFAK